MSDMQAQETCLVFMTSVQCVAAVADIPIRFLRNIMRHPNFGGKIRVLGPGWEKLTYEYQLEKEEMTDREGNALWTGDRRFYTFFSS